MNHRYESIWVGRQLRAYCWCGWASRPDKEDWDGTPDDLDVMEESIRQQFWEHLTSGVCLEEEGL